MGYITKLATIAAAAVLCCTTPADASDVKSLLAGSKIPAADTVNDPHVARSLQALAKADTDILKFAFALECLEAQFYSWAAYGHGLSVAQRGGGPAPIGGKKAALSDKIRVYAQEIADNEIAHVAFIKKVLGDTVQCPLIDIGTAFANAADAAIGSALTPRYSPYTSDSAFLIGAFIFEDVGVTAYGGAAKSLVSKDVLSAAAGIMAIEAYHAGIVRNILYEWESTTLKPYKATDSDVANAISALRAAVGGGKDQGITVMGKPNLVPADANSIAFQRTAEEVMAIVYLGDATKPGGFFPNGMSVEKA